MTDVAMETAPLMTDQAPPEIFMMSDDSMDKKLPSGKVTSPPASESVVQKPTGEQPPVEGLASETAELACRGESAGGSVGEVVAEETSVDADIMPRAGDDMSSIAVPEAIEQPMSMASKDANQVCIYKYEDCTLVIASQVFI